MTSAKTTDRVVRRVTFLVSERLPALGRHLVAARNLDKHNNERQPSNSTFGGAARGYGRAASTLPSIFEATLLIGAHIHELVTWAAVSDAGAFAQIASSDVATFIMVPGNGVLFMA